MHKGNLVKKQLKELKWHSYERMSGMKSNHGEIKMREDEMDALSVRPPN